MKPSPEQLVAEPVTEKRRFQIMKLEERIAPSGCNPCGPFTGADVNADVNADANLCKNNVSADVNADVNLGGGCH